MQCTSIDMQPPQIRASMKQANRVRAHAIQAQVEEPSDLHVLEEGDHMRHKRKLHVELRQVGTSVYQRLQTELITAIAIRGFIDGSCNTA